MKPCNHSEHRDAHEDPETGWVITGDEAYTADEWRTHGGFGKLGPKRRYRTDEEKRLARNARLREQARQKREAA